MTKTDSKAIENVYEVGLLSNVPIPRNYKIKDWCLIIIMLKTGI